MRILLFSYFSLLFSSQSELSFLRNQLEESKLQQQELTDSIEEKVRFNACVFPLRKPLGHPTATFVLKIFLK